MADSGNMRADGKSAERLTGRRKRGQTPRVSEIVESTTLLSKAFSGFFKDEAIAREVAFHLADIEPELMVIHGLLQEIKKTGKANKEQVAEIVQAVCIHWKYHGEEIEKLVSAIPQEKKGTAPQE